MRLMQTVRRTLRDAFALTPTPNPLRRTWDFGVSVAISTAMCFAVGQQTGASLAALTILFIYFLDFGGPPRHRAPTIFIGLLLVIGCGILGHLAAPFNAAQVGGVFVLSLLTGWTVNSGPRVLQIFRFGTVAFLVTTALPEIGLPDIAFIVLGAAVSFLVSSATDSQSGFSRRFQVGNLRRETHKLFRSPRRHRRFALTFGTVAALGLVLGQELGLSHPYWITVTTIFTMQPEAHIAFTRLFQRVTGTLVAVPVTLLLLSVAHQPLAMAACLVIAAFLFPVAFARNYLLASTVIVIFIIIAIGLGYASHTVALHLLWARMDETLVGAILAAVGILITYADRIRPHSLPP